MTPAAFEFWAYCALVVVLVAVALFAFVFGPQAIQEWREIFTEDGR